MSVHLAAVRSGLVRQCPCFVRLHVHGQGRLRPGAHSNSLMSLTLPCRSARRDLCTWGVHTPTELAMRRTTVVAGALVALAACSTSDRVTGNNFNLTPPSNLTYQLIPSGNADEPEGIDLRWDPVNDPNISDYAVFSRASTSDQWSLRAQTTSPSFEDLGQPDLQYYVAS